MKTLKLSFIAVLFFVVSGAASAQISIKVTINPPDWGPSDAVGVRFYYLPDIQVYYDVEDAVFIYPSHGRWIRAAHLPASYGSFNLYTGYKVVLKDYHGERPYDNFDDDRQRYPHGYGRERRQETYGAWRKEHHDHDDGHGHGDKGHHDHGEHGHGNHGNGHGHGDDDDD